MLHHVGQRAIPFSPLAPRRCSIDRTTGICPPIWASLVHNLCIRIGSFLWPFYIRYSYECAKVRKIVEISVEFFVVFVADDISVTFFIVLDLLKYGIMVVCVVATISAIQEGYYIIKGREII